MRTGKSIIFANCSCRSSDQDVNCGTISLPISFPTEWLIPSDSTAFLAEKEKNIAEIAFETGYQEQSNFTRAFTKFYGKTPSQYIKSQQSSQQ